MAVKVAHEAERIVVRHIKRILLGTQVLNSYFRAQPLNGINGEDGWASGQYEVRLGEDGSFTLRLPNGVGGDGVLHRNRFAIITDSAVPGAFGSYRPGEEWLEFYREPGHKLLFVGTPVSVEITRSTITITGVDGARLLAKARSSEVDFWHHAPRDVFDYYTRLPVAVLADDFSNANALAPGGQWTLPTNGNGAALGSVVLSGGRAAITSATGIVSVGARTTLASANPIVPTAFGVGDPTRVEFEVDVSALPVAGNSLFVSLAETNGYNPVQRIQLVFNGAGYTFSSTTTPGTFTPNPPSGTNVFKVVIEIQQRWTFLFINGQLVHVCTTYTATPGPPLYLWFQVFNQTSNGPGTTVYVDKVAVRVRKPALLRGADKGDYRLPGAPTPGGLRGAYYDDQDLRANIVPYNYFLSPIREPYAYRLDPQINFNSNTWMVAQPSGGEYFSVRWTGSIYLSFGQYGRKLRITGLDDACRMWVGKTDFNDRVISWWQDGGAVTQDTTNLKTHLTQNGVAPQDGWYPIVIEYAQRTAGAGITLQEGAVDSSGTNVPAWATVVPGNLSPYGCFEDQIRYTGHREAIDQVCKAFGLQWTCEPRSLESGEFPGQMIPRIRAGRDTEYVVDQLEGDSMEEVVQINADDTVDSMLADAAGIAANTSGDQSGQLTAEMFDGTNMMAHLLVHSDYESLSEISEETLLKQRLASMLALRLSAWQQVSVRPARGDRQLLDTWPLTGAAALFDWAPGDGVRLQLPLLSMVDRTPRQITGVAREFTPLGRRTPIVSFRQRPRGLRELIERMQREARSPQRNYQGQLVAVTSNVATSSPNLGSVTDTYARVGWPNGSGRIVRAWLVVHTRAGGTVYTIEINGVAQTGQTIDKPGRYDITNLIARESGGQRVYVKLVGGTGTCEWSVELHQRV